MDGILYCPCGSHVDGGVCSGRHAFAHLTKNGKITILSDAISSNSLYSIEKIKEKRLDFCPDKWVDGRIFVWITNGKQNLQYNKYESMLPGFRYGRTNMKKGK